MHPFEAFFGFGGVDNVDKHRSLELAVVAPSKGRMRLQSYDDFLDCKPTLIHPGGPGCYDVRPSDPPQAGDEVLNIPVTATGPNPDVKLEIYLAGYIALRKTWKIPDSIETLAKCVEIVLGWFPAG
jgi:hypothetical protein